MKHNTLAIVISTLIFSLIFASCGGAPSSAAFAAEAQPAQAAAAATEPPAPAPTEAPAPIPCTIAFDSDRDGNREVYTMGPDGSDLVNLSKDPGDDFEPAWAPDGTQIAFVSNRANETEGGQYIYVANADGSALHRLTEENSSRMPDWSPDGKRIAYSANGDIYVIAADGSSPSVNLTNSPEEDVNPGWSPDSSRIAWMSGSEGGWNIFVMDGSGGTRQKLTDDGKVSDVQWSVDGQLFTHWDNQEAGCFNCVMDADGKNIKDAGGKGEIQRYLPFWTPDGLRVECISGDLNGKDDEIYLVGTQFPDVFLNLSNNPAADRNPDWPFQCGPAVEAAAAKIEAPETANGGELVLGYEGSGDAMSAQDEAELLQACAELQIQCVRGEDITALADQNVGAILSFSNKWKVNGDYPKIHDAVSKGNLVLVLNAESGEPGVYNLSNEYEAVRAGLLWMFDQMGGVGDFAYYNFGHNETHQVIIDEVLKENPGVNASAMPAEFEGDSLTEDSIAELAASNPKLKGIWTDNRQNDVFWGLHNSHADPLPAFLCEAKPDMFQAWKNWLNENPEVESFSTINPGGTGYEGVYAAHFILNGSEINPAALGGMYGNTFKYDFPIITNDNLDEWLAKAGTLPNSEWGALELPPMTPQEIKEKWFK